MNVATLTEAELCNGKWKSILVGDAKYSISATERDGCWYVYLTNLIEIWSEELDREKILQKCEKLNPSLSIEDIDAHQFVSKILKDIPNSASDVSVEQIKLSSELEGGVFEFAIDLTKGSALQLWEEVTMPLCVAAGELSRRQSILLDLMKRKDAEISEYKLNGAELTRKHIGTEPFSEDSFEKNASALNLEGCLSTFQRIVELRGNVKTERFSAKAEPGKKCFPESRVRAVISSATHDEAKPKSGKRFRHTLLSVDGPARQKRRRCVECYRKRRQSGLSATDAASLTKQVKTYCDDCSEMPHLCLPCFNSTHENICSDAPDSRETPIKIEVESNSEENNVDTVIGNEAPLNIEDKPASESVTRGSNAFVPKLERTSPPESPRLPMPSKSQTERDDCNTDKPKRTRSGSASPAKRTRKNIHDFIK